MSKKQKARIKEKREEKKNQRVKKKAKLRHKDTKTLVNAVKPSAENSREIIKQPHSLSAVIFDYLLTWLPITPPNAAPP